MKNEEEEEENGGKSENLHPRKGKTWGTIIEIVLRLIGFFRLRIGGIFCSESG